MSSSPTASSTSLTPSSCPTKYLPRKPKGASIKRRPYFRHKYVIDSVTKTRSTLMLRQHMIDHSTQIRPRLLQRSLRRQPILHPQRLHLAVLDKRIRPAHPHNRHLQFKLVQRLHHSRPKPTGQHMILQRHHQPALAAELCNTLAIDWLRKARVDDRR